MNKKETEKFIKKAMEKVGVKKESKLCQYIPDEKTGCIHHFKYARIKEDTPEKACALIDKYIIQPKEPKTFKMKRGARGESTVILTKEKTQKILEAALKSQNQEILNILATDKLFKTVRAELIASIYRDKPNTDLWSSYNILLEILKKKPE